MFSSRRRRPSALVILLLLAILRTAIRRRLDFHGDFHGEMIRRRTIPIALQRDSIARVMYHCDTYEVLISDNTARWIEIDPAGAGSISIDLRGTRLKSSHVKIAWVVFCLR